METKVDLSKYKNSLNRKNQILRLTWSIAWSLLGFLFPRSSGMVVKIVLLKIYGADIEWNSKVYSGARIYQPWKLRMGKYSTLADKVDCYNVDWVIIGAHSTISQDAYLCTASHDIQDIRHRLVTAPIVIEDGVWVGARAFINMGVTLKGGSVIGGFSYVYKDVDSWNVVSGNPSRVIKIRTIRE